MDKDTEIVEREPVDTVDRQEPSGPVSVKDSIRAAIKTVNEEVGDKGEKNDKKEAPVIQAKETKEFKDTKVIKAKDEDKENKVPEIKKEKEVGEPKVSETDKEVKATDIKPPAGLSKEAKAIWNDLPEVVRKDIAKREKDFSSGIAGYAAKAKAYDEFDAVIKPRAEAIQRFGTTPAQTVDRLFQWMEALSHPDANSRKQNFLKLAKSFQIEFNSTEEHDPTYDPNKSAEDEMPAWAKQIVDKVNGVEQQTQTFKQQQEQAQQSAAVSYINRWAQDKTHFQTVRPLMFSLLSSNTIPLKADGSLDLDEAYNRSIKAHPETSDTVIEEEATKKAEAVRLEAEKKAKDQADKVAKAKAASSSIKVGAPGSTDRTVAKKDVKARTQSVRESIMSALQEARN